MQSYPNCQFKGLEAVQSVLTKQEEAPACEKLESYEQTLQSFRNLSAKKVTFFSNAHEHYLAVSKIMSEKYGRERLFRQIDLDKDLLAIQNELKWTEEQATLIIKLYMHGLVPIVFGFEQKDCFTIVATKK